VIRRGSSFSIGRYCPVVSLVDAGWTNCVWIKVNAGVSSARIRGHYPAHAPTVVTNQLEQPWLKVAGPPCPRARPPTWINIGIAPLSPCAVRRTGTIDLLAAGRRMLLNSVNAIRPGTSARRATLIRSSTCRCSRDFPPSQKIFTSTSSPASGPPSGVSWKYSNTAKRALPPPYPPHRALHEPPTRKHNRNRYTPHQSRCRHTSRHQPHTPTRAEPVTLKRPRILKPWR
jgi:hypothetical protein